MNNDDSNWDKQRSLKTIIIGIYKDGNRKGFIWLIYTRNWDITTNETGTLYTQLGSIRIEEKLGNSDPENPKMSEPNPCSVAYTPSWLRSISTYCSTHTPLFLISSQGLVDPNIPPFLVGLPTRANRWKKKHVKLWFLPGAKSWWFWPLEHV